MRVLKNDAGYEGSSLFITVDTNVQGHDAHRVPAKPKIYER
ncbi:hypothetical protein [Candidatus Jettenia sp. AMX1]|nr:hypothetical protein [Candidatus Jettenia sp. AMX1]WKZ17237.1 MAG: hypothetical protein QY317_07945 [Candidatus Jettenia caeni]